MRVDGALAGGSFAGIDGTERPSGPPVVPHVAIGSPARLLDGTHLEALQVLDELEFTGRTAVVVLLDGAPDGVLGFTDRLRPDAARIVTDLRTLTGCQPLLLTGDNLSAARRVAVDAGLVDMRAGLLPQDKVAALREQEVLGTDETPAPVTATGAATSEEDCTNPHVFTVRTMRAYTPGADQNGADLVWYGAAGTRRKTAITAFGILDGYHGVLVRDDFGGYLSYDQHLAGVQQCLSHLLRYLQDACDIDPAAQIWTLQVIDALRTAIHTANTARRNGHDPDQALIARLRNSYQTGVAVGISANLSRAWHKGNHPALILARRLQRKAEQVWLFTQRLDVPPTNNGSEAAIRGFKLAAKVQGCWRSLSTLQRHCRIRSYLVTAANHGRRPIDAIRDALTGTPWMPPRTTRYALAA